MSLAPASYRAVFTHREFMALLAASLVSMIGDQVARIALSVLVYQRTQSAVMSAAVFAVSYLPWVLGGPLLATLGDRLPPRRVLIGCDLMRAVIVLGLVIPGVPIWLLLMMIFVAELAAPPFESTRSALMPTLLPGDDYVIGVSVMGAVQQGAQVLGFAVGGLILTVLTPREALYVDALSFVVSALLLLALRARPAAAADEHGSLLSGAARAVRVVWRTPRLRLLILMAWLGCGVSVVSEGVAAPYSRQLGHGVEAVGLLLATVPLGCALGGLAITRLVVPERRLQLLPPLVCLAGAPLLLLAVDPPLPAVLVVLTLSGVGSSAIVLISTTVGREVDPDIRGRVFSIAASGLMVSQGAGVLAGGALAHVLSVHAALAVLGLLSVLLSGWATVAWRRVNAASPPPDDRAGGRVDIPAQSERPATQPPAPSRPATHP